MFKILDTLVKKRSNTLVMPLIKKGIFFFLSFGVAGYALFTYGVFPLGALVHPEMKTAFLAHPVGIYTHVFASVVALTLGPFQFSPSLRERYINIHRWAGRVYLVVGVFLGGVSGLYLSQYAFGGVVARLGFAVLAVFWLYTGLHAYLAIRHGALEMHRKWVTRNFSLTFAAVTLRLYLPLSMASGLDFEKTYPVIAWLCWMPNLIFVEWRYNYSK